MRKLLLFHMVWFKRNGGNILQLLPSGGGAYLSTRLHPGLALWPALANVGALANLRQAQAWKMLARWGFTSFCCPGNPQPMIWRASSWSAGEITRRKRSIPALLVNSAVPQTGDRAVLPASPRWDGPEQKNFQLTEVLKNNKLLLF